MLKTAEALYRLGATPLWIKPKSKAPVQSGWTEAPRPELSALLSTYRVGMNLGVRLGNVSRIGDGYLAVIDVDVKSSDPKHKKEAYDKVREFLSADELARAPITHSGRGNGSAHVWIRTVGPATPKRLSQSNEKVEVLMPSAGKPSPNDLKILGEEKVKAGLRLRPAWEVSLMGQGQQVVVPPSIHPDTNRAYIWKREFTDAAQLPIVDTSSWNKAIKDETKVVQQESRTKEFFDAQGPLEIVEVKLDDLPNLDPGIRALIEDGNTEGFSDNRSDNLLFASIGLVKAGATRNQIVTLLTEPGTYLGDAPYAHTQDSTDRPKAMRWLAKYTVDKAFRQYSAELDFLDEAVIEDVDPQKALSISQELIDMTSWRAKLERTGGKTNAVKSTLKNVLLILDNLNQLGGSLFAHDEFKNRDHYVAVPPWGGVVGKEINDLDISQIRRYFSRHFGFEPPKEVVYEAIHLIAKADNSFHPIKNWLASLEWDGVPRVDTWLRDYMGATEQEPYLSSVSRKLLCALVDRAMNPGQKYDYVVVLEGNQGIGKSTLLANLVGREYFSDAKIDIGDKDAILNQRGVWLHEFGEMASIKSQEDVNMLKAFITTAVDRCRVPYGKLPEDFPRQTVFVGTTNQDKYLRDPTGNRRYWAVHVTKSDFKGVAAVRDQLFAEAMLLWGLGEPLYLENPLAREQAEDAQEARMEHDPMAEALTKFFANAGGLATLRRGTPKAEGEAGFDFFRFSLSDLFDDFGPLKKWKGTKKDENDAAEILKKLGCFHGRPMINGLRLRLWSVKEEKWPQG